MLFGPKLAIFSCFFFSQSRPEKCVLCYSRAKKRHLGYKYKKLKRFDFSKVVSPWFWSKIVYFFMFLF